MEVFLLKQTNKQKTRVLFEIGTVAYLYADRNDPKSREIFLKWVVTFNPG